MRFGPWQRDRKCLLDGFSCFAEEGERSHDFVKAYYALEIAGRKWRAISWTTAPSLCAVAEIVSNGFLPGKRFLKKEGFPLDKFLKTVNGGLYAAKGDVHTFIS